MPRINLYVDDEMKASMDAIGDVNWSGVAQAAFNSQIARHMNGHTMDAAITRLKASKAEEETSAEQHGREWAAHHATFAQLKKMAKLNENNEPEDVLTGALCPKGYDREDFENITGFDLGNESATYTAGFVRGALAFFEEVEDKL